jgi:hypothetical protein
MVLSWALTGVIRYTFYAASLVGWEFTPPLWAQYSAIFVLYPIGASSQLLVNRVSIPMFVVGFPGEPPFFSPVSAISAPVFSPALTGEGWCSTQAIIYLCAHDQTTS